MGRTVGRTGGGPGESGLHPRGSGRDSTCPGRLPLSRAPGIGDRKNMTAPRTPTSIVLLSGGLDSSTALALAAARGDRPEALFVDYGQEAAGDERAASERVALSLGVPHTSICLDGLDISDGEILGRNAMLISVALMAIRPPAALVIGVHSGTDYWDCSREFLSRMQAVLNGYGAGAIQLLAPFAALDKAAIHAIAREHGLDPSLIYSCEHADGPCGQCVSCKDIAGLAR